MNTVEGEKEAAKRESSEVLHQQEEDADQEIEEMRDRYSRQVLLVSSLQSPNQASCDLIFLGRCRK